MSRLPTVVLSGLLLLHLTSSARADLVSPRPDDCPPGTTPTTDHSGPHCTFAPPCDAASCGAAERCAPLSFCVREVDCGGLVPPDSPPCTRRHVIGPCDAQGRCAEADLICVPHAVCTAATPPPSTTPPPTEAAAPAPSPSAPAPEAEESGGGCHATRGADSSPLALMMAAGILLAWRRRA